MSDNTLTSPPAGTDTRHRPRHRRLLAAGTVAVILAAAAVIDLAHPFGTSPSHPFGQQQAGSTTTAGRGGAGTTATVTRRSLSSQTTVDATLGYADNYTVTNQLAGSATGSGGPTSGVPGAQSPGQSSSGPASGQGVVTKLPKAGRVITQGQVLYRVDGEPAVLLYGSTPAYRTLAAGVTGDDVRQLNADLVALGYASRSDLDPSSDEFSWATAAAVKKLQDHLGIDQTGVLDLGQVVFLPTAIRVTSLSASLGAAIAPGTPVLTGTSTTRQVAVDLDTSEQSEVKPGNRVSITLPSNQTTPGVVSAVGTVAASPGDSGAGGQAAGSAGQDGGSSSGTGSSGNSTIEVDVRLTHPAAARAWDQAPVQVTITTDTVHDALVVPVVALLAQAGGGYAVEVVAANGTHHIQPVTLGLFDDADGLVQVTSTGVVAGQHVEVPKL
jgi:hypothetical protein